MTEQAEVEVNQIARQMGALHSEYYGSKPSSVDVHVGPDVVIVVIEESFTPAERTLIGRGEAQAVQAIRRTFQQVMSDRFCSIIEKELGRTVRTFISDTDLDQELAVEVFLLVPSPEDEREVGREG